MRKTLLWLATGASLIGGASAALAMPTGTIAGADANPGLILVSGGCGPAFHRTPFGACRPNVGFYGRPYGYGRPYYRGNFYRHY